MFPRFSILFRTFAAMKKEELKIVFMGTPEFAVGTLQRLVEGGYNVVAVVTQPDKPVGRHQDTLQPSEVKRYALEHGLPVLQPEKMKDPVFVEELRSYGADLQVVVAFRMLPEVVWDMPRFGTFNVHAALLPQYRGAAPINWAVINGETKTGVTTFFLDHDIDTGRIILQKPFAIPDDADVEYVYDGLMHLGADIAVETIDRILEGDGQVEAVPQEEWNATPGESRRQVHRLKDFQDSQGRYRPDRFCHPCGRQKADGRRSGACRASAHRQEAHVSPRLPQRFPRNRKILN